MTLTLTVVRCPDDVTPERREAAGGEISIGRGPDNDWILPDPHRHLSKRHCCFAFRSGRWQVCDLSANGTFLNHSAAPLGAEIPHTLRNGDRVALGAYELEVGIAETAGLGARTASSHAAQDDGPNGFGGHDLDPFAAPAPSRHDPFADQRTGGLDGPDWSAGVAGRGLHDDSDPFAEHDFPAAAPAYADHAPALQDAFRPPAAGAIPDDWDLDLPAPPPPPRAAALDPSTAAAAVPGPDARPASQPVAAQPAAADGALLAAFLRGAGLSDAAIPDPEATMERLGAAFRATVAGIRETMIARASIKGEFRIEQTMIQASGNNPLKFSAGDEDALAALLGIGRRRAMPAHEAIADALRDIRLHELATISAMQRAVEALLATLSPTQVEREAERGGLLAGQRKARAWEAFQAAHARIMRALSDDFDSVFGRSFARAYEQGMRELQGRDGVG